MQKELFCKQGEGEEERERQRERERAYERQREREREREGGREGDRFNLSSTSTPRACRAPSRISMESQSCEVSELSWEMNLRFRA